MHYRVEVFVGIEADLQAQCPLKAFGNVLDGHFVGK